MDSYRMDKSINGRKDGHVLRKIVRIRRNDGCRFRVVLFPELYLECFYSAWRFCSPISFCSWNGVFCSRGVFTSFPVRNGGGSS